MRGALTAVEMLNRRHKLTQFDVFGNAPGGPGAYALLDEGGAVVWVAWAPDLSQQLMKHLPANERQEDLKGRAKSFCVLRCDDEATFTAFFDGFVEKVGTLPLVRSCVPEGSRYAGHEGEADTGQIDVLLARVRQEAAAENLDGALKLLATAAAAGAKVPDYHVLVGQLTALKGFTTAIEHFEQAAELDPTSPAGLKAAALAERCYDLIVGFQKI